MAVAAARITSFLKAVADAGADLLAKIAFGTPGSQVVYPEATPDNQAITGARDTGQVYLGAVIPGLLTQIGAEMDRAACAWAYINTNQTGVAPTLVAGHTNVSSVTKDEALNILTVHLDIPYATATYFFAITAIGFPNVTQCNIPVGSSFSGCLLDMAGAIISINNRTVMAFSCGQT